MSDEFDRFIAGFEQRSIQRLTEFEKALERVHRAASDAAEKKARERNRDGKPPPGMRSTGVPRGPDPAKKTAPVAAPRPRAATKGVLRRGWN
ncbi:hypothetical protein M0E87_01130 [Corynebacterium sp. CCM 9185]|uniref:Uncharacterized protein n=1 Tax=Corynebacterium marambiense TaxID=2765364 RepID=A0ABS0VRM7_9CORY|nr:hypothetical protein [Corynebacterium marambiense]MBI8999437.1 hypothetical protein [Corynebacterium marambiense]MCK7662275.1 hypothetical protein [Corynebacterium marambiense]MCX7541543.1 hypothetical protein [Corynebacterium marambiense]